MFGNFSASIIPKCLNDAAKSKATPSATAFIQSTERVGYQILRDGWHAQLSSSWHGHDGGEIKFWLFHE